MHNFYYYSYFIVPTGIPQNLKVTVINSTSLFIQWSSINAAMANGLVVSFRVALIEMNTNSTFGVWNFNGFNITLPNLHPYYVYQVYVAGTTIIGTGPSAEYEVMTHPAG